MAAVEGGIAEEGVAVLVLDVDQTNIVLHEFLNDANLILFDGLDQLPFLHHAVGLLGGCVGYTHRDLLESLHVFHSLDLLHQAEREVAEAFDTSEAFLGLHVLDVVESAELF